MQIHRVLRHPSVAPLVLATLASSGLLGSCIIAIDADGDEPADRYVSAGEIRRDTEPRTRSAPRAAAAGVDANPTYAPDPAAPSFDVERFRLPNGLEVVLHRDPSLPKVVVNTWFQVGSKDEEPGRTGFAHLFEHLMFMGTGRVPDNQFDVIMETGGGWNNASTSSDRTNYYSQGPAALLPTLLWLDADRFEALDDHMTQAKLDSQRAVVRNERRQTSENVPYGKAELLMGELLYPQGHPYHHPVIGSHADLEAATVEDVVAFFRRWYVPGNASLVVAGDFDPDATRALIEDLYGAIPPKAPPVRERQAPATLTARTQATVTDDVEFAKLYVAWHSPALYAPGDGEMDLAASVLADGPSSRLFRRLVLETGMAQEVDAAQYSGRLGSTFVVEVLAARDVPLQALEAEVLAALEELGAEGPSDAELRRVRAQVEANFLRRAEDLGSRADAMNGYLAAFGTPDGFARDLARWTGPSGDDVARWVRSVFGPSYVSLRVLPDEAAPAVALDTRPEPFPTSAFTPPEAVSFELSNGIPVHAVPRPGTGLVSGYAWFEGGALLVPTEEAGTSGLVARMLESGAAGLDAAEFAAAVESLGAEIDATADSGGLFVGVTGLNSALDETLDRFRDVIRRPNLTAADFERERGLQLADIAARSDDPRALSTLTGMRLVFGDDDPRGRSTEGEEESVAALTLAHVEDAYARLLDPGAMTLVFAGDFTVDALRASLEARFGDVARPVEAVALTNDPKAASEHPGLTLVDRPGAPQTMIYLVRPVPNLEGVDRAVRATVLKVFGGMFTSRLNANLREEKNYTYGAGAGASMRAFQEVLLARTAVFTDVTGPALAELKAEFDAIATSGVTPEELTKGLESRRSDLVATAETTADVARTLFDNVAEHRPLDAVAQELAALDEVTLERANALAASGLFDWSSYTIVLVGDVERIRPQLEEAGFDAPQ